MARIRIIRVAVEVVVFTRGFKRAVAAHVGTLVAIYIAILVVARRLYHYYFTVL